MSPPRPNQVFGHVFQTKDLHFYYDVNTNQILEIDPELAAVIPLFGTMSQEDLVQSLKETWPEPKILEACAIIETARKEEGLFLAFRPLLAPPDPKLARPGECDSNFQHLVLTVTERCNLRCRYCVHGADLGWVRGHEDESMSPETALESLKYFLDRVEPGKKPMISFYGGEALLELDLIEIVIEEGREHPRGKDAMFIIDTNGVLLTDRAIDLVIRKKVFLQISIDGPAMWHDQNRVDAHGNGTFDKVLANLDKLLGRDPTTYKRLSFVATMAPPTDLFELADFFADFPPFVKHGIPSPPSVRVNSANLKGQDWSASKEDFLALGKQVEQARKQYLEAVTNGTRDKLSPVIRELFEPEIIKLHHRSRGTLAHKFTPGGNCRPGQRKLHVTVDGRFQPCERTGCVMELGSLQAGIESPQVLDLQDQFHDAVKDKCTDCWALRLCGVCFAVQAEHVKSESGERPVPEAVCRSVRRDREVTLKMLVEILKLPEDRRRFLEESVVV